MLDTTEAPCWIGSCTEHKLKVGLKINDYLEPQLFQKLDVKISEYCCLYLKKSCT